MVIIGTVQKIIVLVKVTVIVIIVMQNLNQDDLKCAHRIALQAALRTKRETTRSSLMSQILPSACRISHGLGFKVYL